MLKCKFFKNSHIPTLEDEFETFCDKNGITANKVLKIEQSMIGSNQYCVALFYDDIDTEEFLNSFVTHFDPLMNRAQDETIFYQTYPTGSR